MSRAKKFQGKGPEPLEVVKYGHPALRSKGKRVEKVDASIRELAEAMIVTMYEEDGCGLAAHQVGRAIRLAVIDVAPAHKHRPSKAWVGGRELTFQELEAMMPLVMINPEIHPVGEEREIDVEGCLSMPGLHDDVERHARVRILCQDLDGNAIDLEAEGLLSRAAQHENDHLEGILFIDHLHPDDRAAHQPKLKKFQQQNSSF